MASGRETAAGFWFQREKEMVGPAGFKCGGSDEEKMGAVFF